MPNLHTRRKFDHDLIPVEMDIVQRGTSVVLKRFERPGWVCRRCHMFLMLRSEWRPDDPLCQPPHAEAQTR
jgi:hypothetical protein